MAGSGCGGTARRADLAPLGLLRGLEELRDVRIGNAAHEIEADFHDLDAEVLEFHAGFLEHRGRRELRGGGFRDTFLSLFLSGGHMLEVSWLLDIPVTDATG